VTVDAATIRLKLRVSPGARRPGIAGRYGDAWKVRVAEPPEDGRANDAVLRLVSDALGVRAELVSGFASRDKVIEVDGITAENAKRLLTAAAGKERT
jgi:uncharacterized protein (TIGR00251 family)